MEQVEGTLGIAAARTIFVNVVAGGLSAALLWAYVTRRFDLATSLITAGVAALATLPLAWVLVRAVARRPRLPPGWVFVVLWILATCAAIFLSHLVVFTALDAAIHVLPAARFVWTTILDSDGGILVVGGLLGFASRRLLARAPPPA